MTAAIQTYPRLTFDEFLDYDDGTENLYELIDGTLVELPEPARLHQSIARYLDQVFGNEIERRGLPWEPVRNTVIRVPGRLLADGRRPDVAIVDIPTNEAEQKQKGITTTPHMVIVIASGNWTNDLRDKILAYLHLGVPEYWVIDYAGVIPEKYCERGKGVKTIVHTIQSSDYGYDKQEYVDDEVISCHTFEGLQLTTHLIVERGKA